MEPTAVLELRRSRDDAMVAGVCSAAARRLGVDVLLVRVAAALLAVSAGFGVVIYAWAWLVLPQEGRSSSLLQQGVPEARGWSARTLVTIGLVAGLVCCATFGVTVPWSIGPAAVVLLAVLAGRRGLFAPPTLDASPRIQTGAETDFHRALWAWHQRLDEVEQAARRGVAPASPQPVITWQPTTSLPASWMPSTGATAALPRRRASWRVGLVVLVLAGIAHAVVHATVPQRHAEAAAGAAALTVLALALLVSAVTRLPRPRLAVVAGALLALSLLAPLPSPHGVNGLQHTYAWSSAAQIPTERQQLNGSQITYDLSHLDASSSATLRVEANASQVTLLVPADVPVTVDYRLTGADLVIQDGRQVQHIDGRQGSQWSSGGSGKGLRLDLTARASKVVLEHG